MPANLPPEYFEAEKRFKEASSSSGKIAALEDLIATVPKHKGTDKLRADLRRRLSQLRSEAISKKRGGRGDLYVVQKEGAAQIALVGLPNSGKSSLLACLTNARPVIADYPISTLSPLPGMMPYEDIQFQLVDLPPVGNEATDGWVSGILRSADVLLLVIDLTEEPDIQADILFDQLERWNIYSARVQNKGPSSPEIHGRMLKKILVAATKKDSMKGSDAFMRLQEKCIDVSGCIAVSALRKENIEELKRAIFEFSGIIRVYAKPAGKDPDLSAPFTLRKGSTVLDLARVIHKDFVFNLKFARIWGSAKFEGQKVQKDYVLKDRDIVELNSIRSSVE